jgi:hypothetical protein
MTEPAAAPAPVVGVSDLASGTMSVAEAKATIESLKSDSSFGKLLLTKIGYGETAPPEVLAAKSRWNDLHRVAFPTPPQYSPEQIAAMPAHHDARRVAEMNSTRAIEMSAAGYTPIQIHQILGGRPVPPEEHELHEQRYQTLKRDKTFMDRWSKGDRAAVLQMRLAVSGRALRVGSLAEIQKWDSTHPFAGGS